MGGGRDGVVKYIVQQGHHCMLGSDKAGVVQTYFQEVIESSIRAKMNMHYFKLRFELRVVRWALLNAGELRFTQITSAPFFTRYKALLLMFI